MMEQDAAEAVGVRLVGRYCPRCGKCSEADACYCGYCGFQLSPRPETPRPVGPAPESAILWRRWWARMLDMMLMGFWLFGGVEWLFLQCVSLWVTRENYIALANGVCRIFDEELGGWWGLALALFFWEPLIYRIFGNTPGKWLLGLRVRRADGARLSFGAYWRRNIGVWLYGYWCGVPLLQWVPQFGQYRKVKAIGVTSYDQGRDVVLKRRNLHWVGVLFFCLLLIGGYAGAGWLDSWSFRQEAAAKGGDADAQYQLGMAYCDGLFRPKDLELAELWLRRSADQGNTDALVGLGLTLWQDGYEKTGGEGPLPRQYDIYTCFRRAADAGNADGDLWTGVCYLYGIGVAPNDMRARRYLERARAAGVAESRDYLHELEMPR